MEGGGGSLFAKHLAQCPYLLNPPQTPSDISPSPTTLNGPLTLDIAGGMPLIPVIGTVQILVSPRRVTPHLVRPSKVWLVLDPVYDSVHWLLTHDVHLPQLQL